MNILILVTALGACLIAGVFFAFSVFVMQALARLPVGQGIAAMQSINVTVINPLFMAVFMGTAAAALILMVMGFASWQEDRGWKLLAGGALYVGGCFVLTILANVPLNNALAPCDPASPEGAAVWKTYQASWTVWNHLRGLAALGSSILLLLAWR